MTLHSRLSQQRSASYRASLYSEDFAHHRQYFDYHLTCFRLNVAAVEDGETAIVDFDFVVHHFLELAVIVDLVVNLTFTKL